MFSKEIIDAMVADADSVWPKRWPVIVKHFTRCCLAIAYDNVFKNCGLFAKKGDQKTFDQMAAEIPLNPNASYTFQKLLDMLVHGKILEQDGDTYTCLDPMPDLQGHTEWMIDAVREVPEEWAAFEWLGRGADGLYSFLKGKISGEEAMFGPWSDFTLVGEVYFTSEVYGFWSKLAAMVAKRVIETQFDRKINVLEIGAGTGNGTFELFNKLGTPSDVIEKYIFTDIHPRLVKKTSKNFKDYHDFMVFQGLDVTKDLAEQGINEGEADILYAINVMHATNDISEACSTMHRLVAPGGFAILGEISPPEGGLYEYMELTFGLLASYFEYDDKDVRPDSPILTPKQWVHHFKKAGFSEAIAIPGDMLEGSDRGGAIIARK
jgi:ubiquinone/menaquinone biosynthesis C-methylase UbiE